MSTRLSVDLSLNAKGYSQGIQEAKASTEQYNNELSNIKKNLPNARKAFSEAKREVRDLAVALAQMTEEQRNSATGRNMVKMLQDAKVQAAQLQDQIGDLNTEIKNMASDTRALDVVSDSFSLIGNSLSGLAGAYALAGGEEEDFKKAMLAFTSVQSVANALTKAQTLLQKESSVMLAISAAQQKLKTAATDLDTAAQGKNIIATKSATAAQWALNAAADANPYVLLASVIIGLVGAYIAWGDQIKAVIGLQEDEYDITGNLNKKYLENTDEVAKNIVKIKTLQAEYNKLTSDKEREKWIKDNKDAFHELGVEVDDVKDAENLLVNNTDTFIKSLELRAKAAAAASVAQEAYKKALEKQLEAENEMKDPSTWTKVQAVVNMGSDFDYEASLRRERNKQVRQLQKEKREAEKAAEQALENISTLTSEAKQLNAGAGFKEYNKNNKTDKTPKPTKNTTNKDKKETEEAVKGSLADLEKTLSEFQDKYKKGLLPNISPEEYKSQVKEMEDTIKNMKIALGIEVQPAEGSANYFKQKISELEADLGNISIYVDGQVNPEFIDKLNEIKELKEQALTPDEKLRKQFEETNKREAEYFQNQKDRREKDKEIAVKVIQDKSEAYGYYANILGSVGNAITKLSDDEAAQTAGFLMNSAAMIAQAIQNIASLQAQALAEGTLQGSKLPFPANIAAIATIVGTIMSIFSSLPSFADGGVMLGGSKMGDRMLARVNGGEMILNQKQQSNLFNAIDEDRLGSAGATTVQVQGVVRGKDLALVMKNYNNVGKLTGQGLNF